MKKLIIADKTNEDRTLLAKYFSENGFDVIEIDTSFALKKLEKQKLDIFASIIDYNFLAENDIEFLLEFKENNPSTLYIVLTTSKEIVHFFNDNYPDIISYLKPVYPDEVLKVLNKQ